MTGLGLKKGPCARAWSNPRARVCLFFLFSWVGRPTPGVDQIKIHFLRIGSNLKNKINKRIKQIKKRKRLDGLRPKKGPCAQAWSSPCVWIYFFSFLSSWVGQPTLEFSKNTIVNNTSRALSRLWQLEVAEKSDHRCFTSK